MSIRSITPGKRSAIHSCPPWSKNFPVGAASWWAITTSVRSASRSPAKATTFCVGFGLSAARRAKRGPFEASSAISAAAARAARPAGIRRRRPASAAPPAAAPTALSFAINGA